MPKKKVVTKSQIMHLITAVVIVPVSGWAASIVARYFPGIPNLTPSAIEGIFITGCSAALGLGIHYLHGWQLWERTGGKVVDIEDKLAEPVLSSGPPVTVHVHGANPGRVTAESTDTTVQEHGGGSVPGGVVTHTTGEENQPPTSPAPPQAVTTPANEQSQGITGV